MGNQPLFQSDDFDAEALGDEATRRCAEDLRRDGVALIDLGKDALALCDEAVAETEGYFASGARRVQDAWLTSLAVRALACLPQVIDALRACYGRAPFPFQTLNFEQGTEQALHSDMIHFSSLPEHFMCGVWMALEDIEPDSGPLAYVLGSHRLPVLTMADCGVSGRSTEADYPRFVAKLDEQLAHSNLRKVIACPEKGQAIIWTANLAHGGSPVQRQGSTRRSLVTHYYFEDCVYTTPLLSSPGRPYVRAPFDIAQRRIRFSKREGCIVLPSSPFSLANHVRKLVFKKPYVKMTKTI